MIGGTLHCATGMPSEDATKTISTILIPTTTIAMAKTTITTTAVISKKVDFLAPLKIKAFLRMLNMLRMFDECWDLGPFFALYTYRASIQGYI